MKTLRILIIGLMTFLATTYSYATDDSQYWSLMTIKHLETPAITWSTHGQVRFIDDISHDGLYLISEQLKYKALDWANLEIHYTYMDVWQSKSNEFTYQHRLELELNPHKKLSQTIELQNRNRFEFRWIEDKGSDNTRFRQRWGLNFLIPNGKLVKAYFVNNEYFYDFNKALINENRFIPIGIQLPPMGNSKMSLFYMIQSKRNDDWSQAHVLGTHISIAF